jgi:radical SAM superfamily enzyme YgiQ (UPF0313 family)
VLRDIRRVRELGFRKFLLLDDNIASDRPYMEALCGEIAKLGMRWMSQCEITVADDPGLLDALEKSGCTLLSFGLESIVKGSLKDLQKDWADPEGYKGRLERIQARGIDVATEMIVGADSDTLESLRATVGFVEDTPIAAPKFYLLTPIPGTPFFDQMQKEGRILEHDVYRFTASRVAISHPNMSPEEMGAVFWEIYDRLYTLPAILRRTILTKAFWRHPARRLFLLAINLVYRQQIKKRIAPIIM